MTMEYLRAFLEEDIAGGDITSELLVPQGKQAEALITAGFGGIMAGGEEAEWLFNEGDLNVNRLKQDGERLTAGDEVRRIKGDLRQILLRERTCLNIMMIMSGVATETDRVLVACRLRNPAVTIAATRKTFPGLRALQKKAVRLGGGEPHRNGLGDGILVKDNHIQAVGGMEEVLRLLRFAPSGMEVEIEAENMDDALLAASVADIVMLDNMSPMEAERCYKAIKESYPHVLVEVSGGIGPEEAPLYAKAADRISMGYITHSAPSLQFSLHIL
ncbi:MAG TPA: carboxylating nicotinate-nucleotide diphosphorylase [Candidatus Methanomethylophilaceae archaeon]|nr:carboxylating nicotinate-nucleotide diphosphorylase [Candidatus Methanomethylophilaceae archaeon]